MRLSLPLLPLLFTAACRAPVDSGLDTSETEDTAVAGVRVDLGAFRPRNVVVVHVDTLRADALPRWGNTRDTWPLLEAREGWVSVDRAVSTAAWTAPATASLLTGTDQPTHGVRFFDERGTNYPMGAPSFVSYLADQGMRTALVTGSEILMGEVFELATGFGTAQGVGEEPGNAAGTVDVAVDWLDTLDADEPFLLFLQPMDMHAPYRPEEEDLFTWADPADVPFHIDDPTAAQVFQIVEALDAATTDEEHARLLAGLRAVYDEQALGVDRAIDALMAALETRGLLDDTLIVVTADHGESFLDGPPVSLGHGASVRNELVHVPLLFWGAGVVDTHLPCVASNMDVFPTIVDALGLAPLPSAEGRSLLEGCREHAFSALYFASAGVETLGYIGVESREAQVAYECQEGGVLAFDLLADPLATNLLPLADVPGGEALADTLDAYVAEVLTTLPALSCVTAR
ncbi:MAG: sulfatase-like hydrolase/transferase [Myxococcota bacterium]